ncbi:MAG: hypothetical protein GQE15_40935 [Archangiaceae bacterium]|nr:hypothetical protein [Archangiaceae bacterium]
MSLSIVVVSALISAAPLTASQRLADARRHMDELHYDKAARAAEAGLLQADIDHETLVGLFQVAGISWAALDKPAKAKESFQYLLSLKPDFELSNDLPPRMRTPFFEAKSWLSQTTPVAAKVTPFVAEGRLVSLDIVVTDNELLRVKSARITLTPAGGAPEQEPLRLENGKASVAVSPQGTKWRVELFGDRGVLADVQGEATKAEAPPPPPPIVKAPPPVVSTAPSLRWARTVGWVTAIGAGVVAGGGVAAALISSGDRTRISTAARDEQNVVIGMTQLEASRLDARARLMATVANAAFIAAGVLAAGAVVFFTLGAESTPVAVGIGAGNVSASISF